MSESTCLESLYKFRKTVIAVFGPEYLREPTAEDTTRLLAMNASRGFPGMLGSIDCMHWERKNCPFAWQGQYTGHVRACTVIPEAVCLKIFGSGTLSLAWLDHTMISTCFSARRCLLGLQKATAHR